MSPSARPQRLSCNTLCNSRLPHNPPSSLIRACVKHLQPAAQPPETAFTTCSSRRVVVYGLGPWQSHMCGRAAPAVVRRAVPASGPARLAYPRMRSSLEYREWYSRKRAHTKLREQQPGADTIQRHLKRSHHWVKHARLRLSGAS